MPTSIILPLIVSAAGKSESIDFDVEAAVSLLLAEAGRKRGLLSSESEIAFLSKFYYPLWLAPVNGFSLVLDGLNAFSTSFTFNKLPDIKLFIEDVERGAFDRKQFWDSLEKHKKTFSGFVEKFDVKFGCLISDKELLSEIHKYLQDAVQPEAGGTLSVVLAPPRLDIKAASERVAEFADLYVQTRSDLNALAYCLNLLKETAARHEKMIIKEIEFTLNSCEKEISELKPKVEAKVNQLMEELEAEISKAEKAFGKEAKAKEKQMSQLEKKLQQLEIRRAGIIEKLDKLRRKGKVGTTRLERALRMYEDRIKELKKRIDSLKSDLEKNRKQKESEISKMRKKYEEMVEKENNKLRSLEAQADEKTRQKKREIENLRVAVNPIADQIVKLMEVKREASQRLNEMLIPWHVDELSLVCLPFCLVGYREGDKIKTQIIQPMRALALRGFKGTFKEKILGFRTSKLSLHLQPRSKVLGDMLNIALEKSRSSDKSFEENLLRTATSNNILTLRNFREVASKGLEKLKALGWVGQKEISNLHQKYLKEAH
ncbi:MAG: hypothetical protein QXQ41_00620 [Candidatus Bathyarchaeia archaeon]